MISLQSRTKLRQGWIDGFLDSLIPSFRMGQVAEVLAETRFFVRQMWLKQRQFRGSSPMLKP